MSKSENKMKDWEHLYTQFKSAGQERVLCMMHKETKKLAYFDTVSNRFLSKQEARVFRLDVTGVHVIYS